MDWLTVGLFSSVPAPWSYVLLVLASILCGAIVGGERERREKPAGLRTLILVCLGATAFTMVSVVFTTTTGDSGRVAAQIVTGIGFLGAGAILHSTGAVKGLTTAATIWVIAAIGMIVGAGHAMAGLALSVAVRGVLVVALKYEVLALGDIRECSVTVEFEANGGKTQARIEKIAEDYHVGTTAGASETVTEGVGRLTFKCRLPRRHHRDFLNELANVPEVKALKDCR